MLTAGCETVTLGSKKIQVVGSRSATSKPAALGARGLTKKRIKRLPPGVRVVKFLHPGHFKIFPTDEDGRISMPQIICDNFWSGPKVWEMWQNARMPFVMTMGRNKTPPDLPSTSYASCNIRVGSGVLVHLSMRAPCGAPPSSGDHATWFGFGAFVTHACSRGGCGAEWALHLQKTVPGQKRAIAARSIPPIICIEDEKKNANDDAVYPLVIASFQSTSSCNIASSGVLKSIHGYSRLKKRGQGEQERKWLIEMNEHRKLYLGE
jgi:hypothetical protein